MTQYGQNEVNHQRNITFLEGHTKNNSDFSVSFRGCGSYLIKNLFKSWYLVEHKVGICSSDSRSNIARERKQINKSHWPIKVSRAHFIGREQLAKHQVLVFLNFWPTYNFLISNRFSTLLFLITWLSIAG